MSFCYDTGDNLHVRKDYYIYKINLSSFGDNKFKKISFNYLNNESIDTEASAVTIRMSSLLQKDLKREFLK